MRWLLFAAGLTAGWVLNGALWSWGEHAAQRDAYRCGYLSAVREANPEFPDDRHCMDLAEWMKAHAIETNP